MKIEAYAPRHLPEILKLFYDTVHSVCVKDYTPQQLDAWAPPQNPETAAGRWGESLSAHHTLLAWEGERLLGFGDADGTGYLDRLYVAAAAQGQGVGSALCERLETYAKEAGAERIFTHASLTAKRFFENRGYRAERKRQVERQGIVLTNFLMTKTLPSENDRI